jgi:two-component system, cell cycle response regulator DivK
MEKRRVLIIDDNPLNIELASVVLEEAGFVVDGVSEPGEAHSRIATFRPDVILMDIQLPGSDGLALTRAIKADPATHHIAVAAFTAYAMKGDEARMRDGGCDGYIVKPIDVAVFADQVRSVIDTRRPMP